ncbi:MAG: hypothetical protein KKB30_10185 [Proteobacteria bacterium]|nr:hypothetical protein [Pseudomonadota bacterium]MBU1716418.1 hypothetical protein [Pseudomonadota bacterium]
MKAGELAMAHTDHGPEPVIVVSVGPTNPDNRQEPLATYQLLRRCSRDEISKQERLIERENEAYTTCQQHIEKHNLKMKLIKVERYFSGSKIIFYFTAENRVDFRELVKDLVQEFRTRVEIRQIGVRHETKMIGGLGCCGRELCCSSFIKDFAPVSIKMAKEQNLPLNPTKISGVCNRLLCCLTYEYSTYHRLRKGMPRIGKTTTLDDKNYRVLQCNILQENITLQEVESPQNTRIISRDEWLAIKPGQSDKGREETKSRKKKKKEKNPDNPAEHQQRSDQAAKTQENQEK